MTDDSIRTDLDDLTARLAEAEARLREFRFTMPASVRLNDDTILSFEKRDREWSLLATRKADKRPLLVASMEARVLAALHITDLYIALQEAQDAEHYRVEKALAEVRAFLEATKGTT